MLVYNHPLNVDIMEYIRNNIMFMVRLKMRNTPKIEILIMKLMKTCMRFSGTNMF